MPSSHPRLVHFVVLTMSLSARAVPTAYAPTVATCPTLNGVVGGATLLNDPLAPAALDALCMAATPDQLGKNSANALQLLATQFSRPELVNAGVVPHGCSTSGYAPLEFVRMKAARSIAMLPIDVGNKDRSLVSDAEAPTAEMLDVPALFMTGELDNLSGNSPQNEYVQRARALNAPWTYAIRPGGKHCELDAKSLSFIWMWLKAVAALRLPIAGSTGQSAVFRPVNVNLGYYGTLVLKSNGIKCLPMRPELNCVDNSVVSATVSPADGFQGDKSKASWLPDRATAEAWVSLVTDGMGGPVVIPYDGGTATVFDGGTGVAGNDAGSAIPVVQVNDAGLGMPSMREPSGAADTTPAAKAGCGVAPDGTSWGLWLFIVGWASLTSRNRSRLLTPASVSRSESSNTGAFSGK